MILLELFSSTHHLDDWSFTDDKKMKVWFKDAAGQSVEVILRREITIPPHEMFDIHRQAYGLHFKRTDSFKTSGDGKEVSKLFATVIEAGAKMLDEMKKRKAQIDVLVIAAMKEEGHDRPRFYDKLIKRFADKHGFKVADSSDKTVQWLKKNLKSQYPNEVQYLVPKDAATS